MLRDKRDSGSLQGEKQTARAEQSNCRDDRCAGEKRIRKTMDLNTGAVARFEALARMIDSDGTGQSAGAIIEQIERRTNTLKALIRRILACIRRDMVPLFEAHENFYVSVKHSAGHPGKR